MKEIRCISVVCTLWSAIPGFNVIMILIEFSLGKNINITSSNETNL